MPRNFAILNIFVLPLLSYIIWFGCNLFKCHILLSCFKYLCVLKSCLCFYLYLLLALSHSTLNVAIKSNPNFIHLVWHVRWTWHENRRTAFSCKCGMRMLAYSPISGLLVQRAREMAHTRDPIRQNSPHSDNARSIDQKLIVGGRKQGDNRKTSRPAGLVNVIMEWFIWWWQEGAKITYGESVDPFE